MIEYRKEIENQMKNFYSKQNEKWKRLYARIEANKLWYWWLSYIRRLFWCSINTIKKWKEELDKINNKRIRQIWWWRKKEVDKNPEINEYFEIIIRDYIAWNPMKSEVKRTNLSPKDISDKIKDKYWVKTSANIIRHIMKVKWLKKRKMNKGKTLKSVEWRNEQFENISKLKEEYKNSLNPVVSVDVKKKN
jgi:hypothetical protein